jgi:hypothetical protein
MEIKEFLTMGVIMAKLVARWLAALHDCVSHLSTERKMSTGFLLSLFGMWILNL